MHILIVHTSVIPVFYYGGTERDIWYQGKLSVELGHRVTYLVGAGSTCDFAEVLELDRERPIADQIPEDVDVVHFHYNEAEASSIGKPYIITMHGNWGKAEHIDPNTVFISKNHAWRHGGEAYVYNGMDWREYGDPKLDQEREYFHFLGKAAWRIKNLKGAIDVTGQAGAPLHVLGGVRFNFSMGVRLTWTPRVRFHGMVGGEEKYERIGKSKGLVFPVLWPEPMGLAVIESMYFGCPVFATPYGALPELVPSFAGYLTNESSSMAEALKRADDYDRHAIHEYALNNFNALKMTEGYLALFEHVMTGAAVHPKPLKMRETMPNGALPWAYHKGHRL